MSQQEIMRMQIRAMLYNYQSQLLDADASNTELKQVLNSIINDLIQLSGMI